MGDLLLTGATGFVGMELLARYLEGSDRTVRLPVRAADGAAARARVDALLAEMYGVRAREYGDRVRAVPADLTKPRLGLSEHDHTALADGVSTIVHSAASVSFTLPLAEARAINLEGTRRMLDLAERAADRGDLELYGHVSTAYVAGTFAGRFHEHDHDRGQAFHNSYEQSKHEAERLVRERAAVPALIMRPSIVVGDRRSGWTSAFNVLYWPLRAFARGLFTAVPAVGGAPVDVVSVDYVADAIKALCDGRGRIGATYHLAAGAEASTIDEIAALAARYFRRPPPAVVSPAEFAVRAARSSGAERAAFEGGAAYFPYFAVSADFDVREARACLEPRGIVVTPLCDYLERLLDFAQRSRWGKLRIARAECAVGAA